MHFFDSLKFSVRNLVVHRRNVILSVLGIAIGMMSVVITSAIGQNSKEAILQEVNKLDMSSSFIKINEENKTTFNGFSNDDILLSKELSEKEEITLSPLATKYGYMKFKNAMRKTLVVGSDENVGKFYGIDVKYGRLLNKNDIRNGLKVAFIDNITAKAVYKRENVVGKYLYLYTGNGQERFKIIGVGAADTFIPESMYSDIIPSIVCIPYSTMGEYFTDYTVSQLSVQDETGDDNLKKGEKIAAMLNRKNNVKDVFIATDNKSKKDQFSLIIDIITTLINAVAAVSLVVGGFGIMTIMLSLVNERTNEIGIKKAVGATDIDIMKEFLMNAVFLSLLGGALGIISGGALSFVTLKLIGLSFSLNMWFILFSLFFIIAIGVIFGVYPARKASLLDPIVALRREV